MVGTCLAKLQDTGELHPREDQQPIRHLHPLRHRRTPAIYLSGAKSQPSLTASTLNYPKVWAFFNGAHQQVSSRSSMVVSTCFNPSQNHACQFGSSDFYGEICGTCVACLFICLNKKQQPIRWLNCQGAYCTSPLRMALRLHVKNWSATNSRSAPQRCSSSRCSPKDCW